MWRLPLTCAFLLTCGTVLQGQRSEHVSVNPWQFAHLTKADGLASNNVVDMLQDEAGFWWMATLNGLQRFDGKHFKTFLHDPKDPASLPSDLVYALYEDAEKQLWVATALGISRYNATTGTFTHTASDEGQISTGYTGHFFRDVQENLWFASPVPGGLLRYMQEQDRWKTVRASSPIQVLPPVACESGGGKCWFVYKGGLGFVQAETEAIRLSGQHPEAHPLFRQIDQPIHVFMDSQQQLWVVHEPLGSARLQLLTFRNAYGTIKREDFGFHANRVRFCEDARKRLWFFTDRSEEFGYFDLKTGEKNAFRCIPGKKNNPVFELEGLSNIYIDREENIWVLSSSGVFVFNPERQHIRSVEGMVDKQGQVTPLNPVLSFFEASNADIWMGTYFGGTFILDQALRPVRSHLYLESTPSSSDLSKIGNFNAVWSFAEDSSGRIWAGGQFGTLQVFQHRGDLLRRWQLDPAQRTTLRHMVNGLDNTIWVGTQRGSIGQIRTRDGGMILYEGRQGSGAIQSLLSDQKHGLWLQQGGVLARFNTRTKQFEPLSDVPGKQQDIFGIVPWDDSTLLAYGGFLYLFNTNRPAFKRVEAEGVPYIRNVMVALRDHSGLVWLGTKDGFAHWNVQDNRISRYHAHDGLPDSEFNDGHAAYRLRDGRILCSTGKGGFFYFHPDTLARQDPPPEVTITGVDLGADSRFEDANEHGLDCAYADLPITIAYACLSWLHQPGLQFRYRLSGHSDAWVNNGDARRITLYGLTPGSYTLHIQAINRFGLPSARITEFRMRIRPPWWRSVWALLAYAGLIGAGAYLLYRYVLNRKLEQAEVRRIRELESFKSRFYENITHEFRTPLTVLNGAADLIAENPETELQPGLDAIRAHTGRMLTLVNQLLDLSKRDSGFLRLDPQPVELVHFLGFLCEGFQPLAKTRQLRLQFESGHNALYATCDPERLRQIIDNLLANAVKFTPAGGSVTLSLHSRTDPPMALIQVADTGVGIDADALPKLFERFWSMDQLHAGTGIGLALAAELARLMQGRLRAESTPGKGSVFTLELPMDVADKREQGVAETGGLHPETDREPGQRPAVLVVEDNPDISKLLVSMLSDAYDTRAADNGADGLSAAAMHVPDLIISDVMMPEMDGFAFTAALKADMRTSHIPVILLTAKAGLDNKIQGLGTGADAYLEKPFKKRELLAVAEQLLHSRMLLQRYYMASVGLSEAPKEAGPPLAERENAFLRSAVEAIERRLDDPAYSVEQLGADLLMSHSSLHRKIKAVSGQSPVLFIRSVRLQRAKAMLTGHPDMPVYAVAAACGFDDAAYFVRVFKQAYGKTPANWRAAHI